MGLNRRNKGGFTLRRTLGFILMMALIETVRGTPPTSALQVDIPLPKAIARSLESNKIREQSETWGRLFWGPSALEAPYGTRVGSFGTMRLLVVLVKTSDSVVPPSFDLDYVQKFFFGELLAGATPPKNASVADYYRATSRGKLLIEGEVKGWLTLTDKMDYWKEKEDPDFVRKVAEFASAESKLGQYDHDDLAGIGESAQKDGFVDFLAIVYVPPAGQTSAGAYRQKYSKLAGTGGHVAGQEWRPPEDSKDKTGIEDFIFVPANELGTDYSIGTICHEIGHFLGLPDLYRRIGGRQPTDIGHWDLMCWGCCRLQRVRAGELPYVGSSKFPPLLSAWCRDFLGWGERRTLNSAGKASTGIARETGSYVAIDGFRDSDEQLLVEYHTPPNRTSPWGQDLPVNKSGFLVWHVDNRVGQTGSDTNYVWPSASLTKGQNDDFFDATILASADKRSRECPTGRPLLRLVEADGKLDLENPERMDADKGDLFGQQKLLFTNFSRGFGFYRTAEVIELAFEPQGQILAKVDRTPAPSPQPLFAPETLAARAPDFASLDLGTKLLRKVARDPRRLKGGNALANFIQLPEALVKGMSQEPGMKELLDEHIKLRTYSVANLSNATRSAPIVSEKVRKVFGANLLAGDFVTAAGDSIVQRIRNANLPVRNASALEDARDRLPAIGDLLNLPEGRAAVTLGEPSMFVSDNESTKHYELYVSARIGGAWIPMAFSNGTLNYFGDTAFQGFNFDRAIRIKSLPSNTTPSFSASMAIELVRAGLRKIVRPETVYSSTLELFPANAARDEWVLAHKVQIAPPNANPLFTYVDATTGARLR